MKLIRQKPVCNQPSTATLIPQEPDDLWLASNIINVGDIIAVQNLLEIKITVVDYDRDSSALRERGKNLVSGNFHTLDLHLKQQFHFKMKFCDPIDCDKLQEACKRSVSVGADLVVFLMQHDSAHLYLLANTMPRLISKIEGDSNKNFQNVLCHFEEYIDFSVVGCVAIASPNSVNNKFRRYLISESQRRRLKSIETNKWRIICVQTNSLEDVLKDITVNRMIKEAKASMEMRALTKLSNMILSNSDRACYGPKDVEISKRF